jgi:AraC-like DNA-binding protein
VVVAEGRLHGSRNRRTARLIDDARDEALLMVNIDGPHLVEQFGREVVLGAGDGVLVSGTDASSFTHRPPGNLLALRLPKSRLLPRLRDGEGAYMRRIPAGGAALALLRSYVGLTWEAGADRSVARLMADHVVELAGLVVGATADACEAGGAALQAARFEAVRQDIERHIDRSDLSIEILAARHHMTTRTLQRLFETEGTTFTRYLLERRLLRAHGMLGSANARKISAVAYDCGFGDLSYFNRTFRRFFGAAPSDVRAAVAGE